MFAIFINHLIAALGRYGVTCKLFADDFKVYLRITNSCDIGKLQLALDALADFWWEKFWQLTVSRSKCCVLCILVGKSSSFVKMTLSVYQGEPVASRWIHTQPWCHSCKWFVALWSHIETLLPKLICVLMVQMDPITLLSCLCQTAALRTQCRRVWNNILYWSKRFRDGSQRDYGN